MEQRDSEMIKIHSRCLLWGDNFSPRKAEALTGVLFRNKNEPGDFGAIGRYRNKPLPNGRATLDSTFNTSLRKGGTSSEEWLVDILLQHIDIFRACGATDFILHLDIVWKDQCNLQLDSQFIQKIGKLNIPLTLSCEEDSINECDLNSVESE